MILDKGLKKQIKGLVIQNYDKQKLTEFFKKQNNKWLNTDISKVEIYYWDKKNVASRVNVDVSFDSSKIESITDTSIQKIMLNHLEKFHEDKNGKIKEHPELAFSSDGLDQLNKDIAELNNGKLHKPIYKVRTYEPMGNKFAVGTIGNKQNKFVEAAKGTNLFFAIYKDGNGKRNYNTVPLNIVIERQKQGLLSVPKINDEGHQLMLHLSPNDLVYVPNEEENSNTTLINFAKLTMDQMKRIYKMVSSSGKQCFFVRHDIATSIMDKFEFSALNKMEKSIDGAMIKDICIKLKTDRLGKIKQAP